MDVLTISGRKTRMLVDTGSGVTLVGEKVWKELGSSPNGSVPLEEPARAVVVANGETLKVMYWDRWNYLF